MTDTCPTAPDTPAPWIKAALLSRRMPLFVVLVVACAASTACDARRSEDRAPAPAAKGDTKSEASEAEKTEAGGAFDRPILQTPPAADPATTRTFKHYGVGPTVDTAEDPVARLGLDNDTASYALARAAVARGELPPEAAVRVEEFLAAIDPVAPPPAEIAVEVDAVSSPQRKGYQLLRLAVRAPAAEQKPIDVVFAVHTAAPGAIELAASALGEDDRVRVVAVGPKPRELFSLSKVDATELTRAIAGFAPADGKASATLGLEIAFANLPAEAERTRHVAVLSSGVLPPGADSTTIGTLVAAQAKSGTPTSAFGVGHTPYDDTTLEALAHTGRGHYAFVDTPAEAARVIDHIRRPIVATAPQLTITFDPDAVSLYRLIGFESRSAGRPDGGAGTEPSALRAGEATTVLFELKLAEKPKATWGNVELKYAADNQPKTVEVPIKGVRADRPVADAGPDMLLAVIAAGTAEKLRGSYWSRTLSWSQLSTLHAKLPAVVRARKDVAGLGELVGKLAKLDKRGDKFESLAPQARMDFDRLPVLQ